MKSFISLLSVLLALLLPASAQAAEPRPRIGLVLAGGGARGFAHVGVLQWLEQEKIPVDYIAGTSTGGFVGALYAMGHSPDEIAQLIRSTDWSSLMAPVPPPPYRELTIRRKEDWTQFPIRLETGWKNGFAMPSGLNSGHLLGRLIDRLSLPYWSVRHFDDLPIPFRCVVTDMEAGQSMVLESGSLEMALRATMAVPSVFTPVELDGRLLADGGLLDNVPVRAAKDMGARIVIAVDVGAPLLDRDQLESLVRMADQSINIMVLDNIRQSLQEADVVILPELKNYQSVDFDKFESIFERGYEAARRRHLVLKAFQMDEQAWLKHLEARELRRKRLIPSVSSLRVSGTSPHRASRLAAELSSHVGESALEPDRLEADLASVYGQGRDYGIGYGVETTNGQPSLAIRVREKGYGPPLIRWGLTIDGAEWNNIRFGVRGRMTLLDVGRFGAELRLDGALSTHSRLAAEYYLPLQKGFFLAPRAFFDQELQFQFRDGFRVSEYQVSSTGLGLDLGYGFGSRSDEIRLGYSVSHLDGKVRAGAPAIPGVEGRSDQVSARWVHDELDHAVVPSGGWRMEVWARYFPETPGATNGLGQGGARFSLFEGISEKHTLFGRVSGGTAFEKTAPPPQKFLLGGPLRLGSLAPDELWGSRFILTQAGLMRQISQTLGFLGGETVVVIQYEGGTAWEPSQDLNFLHVASAGLLVDSVIGPIFLGGSYGDHGRGRIYFSVGTVFR